LSMIAKHLQPVSSGKAHLKVPRWRFDNQL
jgi:hypothetical protein